jgi:hypothetical protein
LSPNGKKTRNSLAKKSSLPKFGFTGWMSHRGSQGEAMTRRRIAHADERGFASPVFPATRHRRGGNPSQLSPYRALTMAAYTCMPVLSAKEVFLVADGNKKIQSRPLKSGRVSAQTVFREWSLDVTIELSRPGVRIGAGSFGMQIEAGRIGGRRRDGRDQACL